MIEIPAGSFVMGGVEQDKFVTEIELPLHYVEVRESFLMSETPVTRSLWLEVMGSLPAGNIPYLDDAAPVVCVSFHDALAFCRELGAGYRLPTEAEWEYACRSGSSTIFPGCSNISTGDANYLYDEFGFQVGKGTPCRVRSYGRNAFGLSDMIGNVCEWVMDLWHPGFATAPADTTAWIVGGKKGCRVVRGGGWDHLPRVLRASWRDWAPENARWDNLGLRVVKDF
ncbi:formylglycine-generating enzyme family protein [Luteolibacter algae]|uniref:Formylglycine-generating enzyme family protein n=2 Tax=Luteolibacter algae TaxID=454151 RepID=A0ABW5DAA4_9BACT